MIWLEATSKTRFTERLSSTVLFQRRIFLKRDHTYQHIYWASGNYKLSSKFNIGGGLIYFTYHKHMGERYTSIPEIRPFQYLLFSQTMGSNKLSVRVMMEERFMRTVNGSELPLQINSIPGTASDYAEISPSLKGLILNWEANYFSMVEMYPQMSLHKIVPLPDSAINSTIGKLKGGFMHCLSTPPKAWNIDQQCYWDSAIISL